jgi:dynein heavy chain, axonemal
MFMRCVLSGVLQNFARKHKIAIDKIAFDHEIMGYDHPTKPPPSGAFVCGLFVEGASWNPQLRKLADKPLRETRFVEMPVVCLRLHFPSFPLHEPFVTYSRIKA